MDTPEHLELIAQSRPEMLTKEHWKALEDWRAGTKLRIFSITEQPQQPGIDKIAA